MVPEGWKELPLHKLARITSGATPKVGTDRYYDSGSIPFLKIQDLTAEDSLWIEDAGESITEAALLETAAKIYPAGTVLLTMYGTIGIVRITSRPMAANQAIAAFLDLKATEPVFLAWLLRHEQPRLESLALQTTQANISGRVLKSYRVALPPLLEQKKIAAILSSVDEAIAATRAVIEQTKRVKQGLLQTLMTRGIGHTRFKKSQIGEIPTDWDVVSLESLLASCQNPIRSGPFGSSLLKEEFVDEGVPLLGIDNIHEEEFRASYSRFVTDEKFSELARYAVRPRDVVITIMGTVGRTCVLPRNIGPALSSKHLWTMTFDETRYLPELVSLQLNYAPWVRRHFQSHSQGGIMSAIRSDVLKETPLPVPFLDEQKAILSVLDSCRGAGAFAELEVERLQALKTGLLQDLLTGRVRVPLD